VHALERRGHEFVIAGNGLEHAAGFCLVVELGRGKQCCRVMPVLRCQFLFLRHVPLL
jgi:hypothetical protein